jgi:hypothetical protein
MGCLETTACLRLRPTRWHSPPVGPRQIRNNRVMAPLLEYRNEKIPTGRVYVDP